MKNRTMEEIRSAVFGAAEMREEDGALCFSKTSGEQTEAWRRAAEWIVPCVLATTGIRLDFHTDSPEVAVETAGGAKYEVLIDGACSPEKIRQLSAMGVTGFILGTSALFGKDRPYSEILPELRAS